VFLFALYITLFDELGFYFMVSNLPEMPALNFEDLLASVEQTYRYNTPEWQALDYYRRGVYHAASMAQGLKIKCDRPPNYKGNNLLAEFNADLLLKEGQNDRRLSFEYVRGFATCVQTLLLSEKKDFFDITDAIIEKSGGQFD
jgi:hypothetical protein